jgi:hypothetical protein
MSDNLEEKITNLLYEIRSLQKDSSNLNSIRTLLQVNSETPTQPLYKYGWKFCELYTTHSNVYDCIKFLCYKISELESKPTGTI